MGKSKVEQLPTWDLSVLYKNADDPKIDLDLKAGFVLAQKFAKKYRSKLNNNLTSATLLKMLQEYELILLKSVKPVYYAQLIFEANSLNPKHGPLMQKCLAGFNNIQKELMFLELNLVKLSEKTLKNFIKDPKLSNYRHYLESQVKFKPYRLSEPEEKILADKSLTSKQAFDRLFMEHFSRKKFDVKIGKKIQTLSEEQTLNLLYSKNRVLRKAASEAMSRGLKESGHLISFIFNVLSQDKGIEDRLRSFKTPEESRHLSNEIDQKTVDTMTGVVMENYKLVQDFYEFKKRVLGLDKLYDYDRYAPVAETEKLYSYSEAKELILRTLGKFSADFQKIGKEFFDKNWIDAQVRDGKRGGAFCSYLTPDTHPVLLVNYKGKLKDVETLGHELGHGINAYLMRKQTAVNFDNPLTLAETASVFCEMLIFEELKSNLTDKKDLLALHMEKVSGIFATVFRQTSMYKFEQEFHSQRQLKGELSVEEINAIWRKHQSTLYGKSLEITENYDWWWSYVHHFVSSPFYVYAYAFGELLVLALFAKYKKEGKSFVPKYIKFLEAGSSASPQELLSELGVDIHSKKFWQDGMDYIKTLIKETKALY